MKKFFGVLGFIVSVFTAVAAILCGIGYFMQSKNKRIAELFNKKETHPEEE